MQFPAGPLSLQGKVSLCHREGGEREKERRRWDDGMRKEKKKSRHSFSLPIIHRALSMF